jgi:hypothetical protein
MRGDLGVVRSVLETYERDGEGLRQALWTGSLEPLAAVLGEPAFQRFGIAVHAGDWGEALAMLRASLGQRGRGDGEARTCPESVARDLPTRSL